MHNIDKNTNFNCLLGEELIQLCIGQYQVQLKFHINTTISTECKLHLIRPDNSLIEIYSDNANSTKNLVCLLGEKITEIKTNYQDELSLMFSNHHKLIIFGTNKNFESFEIWHKDQQLLLV